MHPKLDLEAFYSHFQVTSCLMTALPGHFRSHDAISYHVTATSSKLQLCRSSNVPKTSLVRLLRPLPGDFRSNNVTSGSLPVISGHVSHFLSRDCHLLRVRALLELKRAQNLT